MNLQQAVTSVLSQYATFTGRARRSEYWFWVLATVIVSMVTTVIDLIIGSDLAGSGTGVVGLVFTLATFIPSFSVGARRLHDTGRSGWLQLLYLVPIVGWILLIVWCVQDSHPDNVYGPNPKAHEIAAYPPPPPAV
ncbi:DUF805 domain-containing protein [Aeromicrobium alkaliterrae]|uniref:DUF805 domain-containing protein n=1 Tax=Aeromicrobium alkaliterrae TaxID=302168 RepID=A0ABP4VGS4_9ACTN